MRRRRGVDPLISMINVVFLLLAFFLMGNFDPSPPQGFALPELLEKQQSHGIDKLFVSKDGTKTWGAAQSEFEPSQVQAPIIVSADARLPASELIGVLGELRRAGVEVAGVEVQP